MKVTLSDELINNDVYNQQALYFAKSSDISKVSKEKPGQKFNTGLIDAAVVNANEAVQKGLLTPEQGDLFIANSLREARRDFGLHPYNTTINLTEGKTREAVKQFFPNSTVGSIRIGGDLEVLLANIEGKDKDPYLLLQPSTKAGEPHKVKYNAVGNGIYANEDPNSPYRSNEFKDHQEQVTYNDYLVNGKAAMIKFLSLVKPGRSNKDIIKAWNGTGPDAEEHTKAVFDNLNALQHPHNKEIKDYIESRKNYNRVESKPNWGTRVDGTQKGNGWLGPIPRKDGTVMTEVSEESDGILYPLLVPTLTQKEIDILKSLDFKKDKIPDSIREKAIKHAHERIKQGKSPFVD